MYEVLEILAEWAQRHGWGPVVAFVLFVVLPLLVATAMIGHRLLL